MDIQEWKVATGVVMAILFASILGCHSSADSKEIPAEWKIAFKGKSIAQIDQILGPPTDNASAKQFQDRVKKIPDGFKVLKVICPDRCDSAEVPSAVWFLTFEEGVYKPVYQVRLDQQ